LEKIVFIHENDNLRSEQRESLEKTHQVICFDDPMSFLNSKNLVYTINEIDVIILADNYGDCLDENKVKIGKMIRGDFQYRGLLLAAADNKHAEMDKLKLTPGIIDRVIDWHEIGEFATGMDDDSIKFYDELSESKRY